MGKAAPAYEEEARKFYEDHYDALSQLAGQLHILDANRNYYYTFQIHDLDSPYIPIEVKQTLAELEEQSEKIYSFQLSSRAITVIIADETYLTVDLLYGAYYEPDNFESEEMRYIALDDDWKIGSFYMLRG